MSTWTEVTSEGSNAENATSAWRTPVGSPPHLDYRPIGCSRGGRHQGGPRRPTCNRGEKLFRIARFFNLFPSLLCSLAAWLLTHELSHAVLKRVLHPHQRNRRLCALRPRRRPNLCGPNRLHWRKRHYRESSETSHQRALGHRGEPPTRRLGGRIRSSLAPRQTRPMWRSWRRLFIMNT